MYEFNYKQKTSIFGTPNIPATLVKRDPIEMLNLPTRLENALIRNYIDTVGDFVNFPFNKIYKFRNIGEKSLKYLAQIKRDIKISPDVNNNPPKSQIVQENTQVINEIEIPREILIDLLLERAGNDRSVKIIRGRYGFQSGEKETLEEIGHFYGVTRERIRQIQEKSIKKMRHPATKGRSLIISIITEAIQKNGMIITDEEADILIPNIFNNNKYDGSSFMDLLCDLGWMQKNKIGDISFYTTRNNISINLHHLMEDIYKLIKELGSSLDISQISNLLRDQSYEYRQCTNLDNLVFRVCKTDPRIEEKLPNKFRLYSSHTKVKDWVRQIVEILKDSGTPLHFTEISDNLNDKITLLGDNRLDVRRVHSILIENPEFSHTGVKGTYGLTEWGFRKETTSELVEECIKKAGFPLYWKQIYNYVSKYKDTKPNNIMAILHTQNKFIKVGRGTFDIRK